MVAVAEMPPFAGEVGKAGVAHGGEEQLSAFRDGGGQELGEAGCVRRELVDAGAHVQLVAVGVGESDVNGTARLMPAPQAGGLGDGQACKAFYFVESGMGMFGLDDSKLPVPKLFLAREAPVAFDKNQAYSVRKALGGGVQSLQGAFTEENFRAKNRANEQL